LHNSIRRLKLFTNKKLTNKKLDKNNNNDNDINIIKYISQFVINMGWQNKNNILPISNNIIKTNLQKVSIEILNEMNEIYQVTPELKQADPDNIFASNKIRNNEFDKSPINDILNIGGLKIERAGTDKKKSKLKCLAFVDSNLDFKKVTKRRKDNSLVRWQDIPSFKRN
jgi:hypothetical protein